LFESQRLSSKSATLSFIGKSIEERWNKAEDDTVQAQQQQRQQRFGHQQNGSSYIDMKTLMSKACAATSPHHMVTMDSVLKSEVSPKLSEYRRLVNIPVNVEVGKIALQEIQSRAYEDVDDDGGRSMYDDDYGGNSPISPMRDIVPDIEWEREREIEIEREIDVGREREEVEVIPSNEKQKHIGSESSPIWDQRTVEDPKPPVGTIGSTPMVASISTMIVDAEDALTVDSAPHWTPMTRSNKKRKAASEVIASSSAYASAYVAASSSAVRRRHSAKRRKTVTSAEGADAAVDHEVDADAIEGESDDEIEQTKFQQQQQRSRTKKGRSYAYQPHQQTNRDDFVLTLQIVDESKFEELPSPAVTAAAADSTSADVKKSLKAGKVNVDPTVRTPAMKARLKASASSLVSPRLEKEDGSHIKLHDLCRLFLIPSLLATSKTHQHVIQASVALAAVTSTTVRGRVRSRVTDGSAAARSDGNKTIERLLHRMQVAEEEAIVIRNYSNKPFERHEEVDAEEQENDDEREGDRNRDREEDRKRDRETDRVRERERERAEVGRRQIRFESDSDMEDIPVGGGDDGNDGQWDIDHDSHIPMEDDGMHPSVHTSSSAFSNTSLLQNMVMIDQSKFVQPSRVVQKIDIK
jgi:hypothetical protein